MDKNGFRKVGLACALALVAGIALYAVQAPAKAPRYITATVERGDIENAVLATGVLEGIRQVDVGAQVSGQLRSLKVKLGDKVSKGQWLAEIGRAKSAQVQIDTAKVNLDYTRISAPIDGDVVGIVTQQGQTVIAQQLAPVILKLADLDTMTVKAQVSEADVIHITPGQPVYFTILGDGAAELPGKQRPQRRRRAQAEHRGVLRCVSCWPLPERCSPCRWRRSGRARARVASPCVCSMTKVSPRCARSRPGSTTTSGSRSSKAWPKATGW